MTLNAALLSLLLPLLAMGARLLGVEGQDKTLSGRAVLISQMTTERKPTILLGLRLSHGGLVQVDIAEPGQLAGVQTGARIEVTGQWRPPPAGAALAVGSSGAVQASPAAAQHASGGRFVASSIRVLSKPPRVPATPQLSTAAAGGAEPEGVGLSSNPLAAQELTVLFVPLALAKPSGEPCSGFRLPKVTYVELRRALYEEFNPGGTTVASTYRQCSYNRTRLTTAGSTLRGVVQLPCGGPGLAWPGGRCELEDMEAWATAAEQKLKEAGMRLERYKYRVFLLPPRACDIQIGLGHLGCEADACRSWIGPHYWLKPQAIAHELGHNLFLAHAGREKAGGEVDSYGDDSCFMGYCCHSRCPNTPHAWQLGWLEVQQVDGASLAPGQPLDVRLASQAASPRSGLRVVPSWAAGVPPLFLGYRTKEGGDTELLDPFVGAVAVYTAAIAGGTDPQPTTLKAALAAGRSYRYEEAGLVVRMRGVQDGAAVVTICRLGGPGAAAACDAGMSSGCDGLAGAEDPACPGQQPPPSPPEGAPLVVSKRVRRPLQPAARSSSLQRV